MWGESQLSEVTSNLSSHTSVPVSSLPENEKHTETLRRVLQRDSVQLRNQNLPSLSNFEGPWEMLAEFGFLKAFLGR